MEFYALPGIGGDIPFDLERNSKGLLDHYVDYAKERILKSGELAPLAVFRSETKEDILHCGPMMKDDDTKEKLAITLRQIAVETEAIGFIFVAEAWTAKYDADNPETKHVQPSQRPDRVECIIVSAQYKGDKPAMRVAEIIRDSNRKITHLLERDFYNEGDMTFEGRFAGVLDDESDDDRWSRITRDL